MLYRAILLYVTYHMGGKWGPGVKFVSSRGVTHAMAILNELAHFVYLVVIDSPARTQMRVLFFRRSGLQDGRSVASSMWDLRPFRRHPSGAAT